MISWSLQSHKIITLSIIESVYSEITEICCKILFVHEILLFMGVVVEYPITMYIDNVGAIFLLKDTSVSQITTHIDVRHHFIRDCVEEGTAKIIFFYVQKKIWKIHLQRT